MTILICRNQCSPSGSVDGHLYIGRRYVCDTSERLSCLLPVGMYAVELRDIPSLSRSMPCLRPLFPQAVSGGIPLLTWGNGVHTLTDGSVIVGEYRVPGVVVRSHAAFGPLYDRIRKAFGRSTDPLAVTLVICETPAFLETFPH